MLLLVGVGEHLQHMRNQVRSRAALLPFEIGVHREIITRDTPMLNVLGIEPD